MNQEFSIRGVFWGDSIEKVRNTEKWALRQPFVAGTYPLGGHIEYEGTLFDDQSCRLSYNFSKNNTETHELQEMVYNFKRQEPSKIQALCSKLEECLMEKYGSPVTDDDEQPPHKGQQLRWITHHGQTVIDLCWGPYSFDHAVWIVEIRKYNWCP